MRRRAWSTHPRHDPDTRHQRGQGDHHSRDTEANVTAAVGALVEPSQDQPAKLADDFINQLGFSQARVSIDTVGTVYVMTDALT